MAGPPAFEVREGTVAFDGTMVLDRIDLTVEVGSFVALLGANGSGKTTLVRAMLGLQPLSAGRVLVHGQPLVDFRDWNRIALVPQRLPAGSGVPVSVAELVASGLIGPGRAGGRRSDRRGRVTHALELVGLGDRRHDRLDTLSGGQQRRVAVARALVGGADTLLLDEPTAGMDLASQARLAATLATLSGCTIVLVAHGLGAMADLVTRAVVLSEGRVAHDGPRAPHGWSDLHHHSDDDHPPTLMDG